MRFTLAILGFLCAIFLWPWMTLACMVMLSARYYAWEVLLMGLFIDLVWVPTGIPFHLPLFTLMGILLVWGFEPLRREFIY